MWRTLASVSDWPDWLPTVRRVVAHDGIPLVLGSRYTIYQPNLKPVTWTVTELDPCRSFAWQSRSPGLVLTAEHSVGSGSTGNSQLTLRFSFAGPLGVLLGWIYGAMTKRYLTQEATSLKERVEEQYASNLPTA